VPRSRDLRQPLSPLSTQTVPWAYHLWVTNNRHLRVGPFLLNPTAKVDAGVDSGKTDAGKKDAGKNDSGKNDAGKNDAGKNDSGKNDSDETDSGKTDSDRPIDEAGSLPDRAASRPGSDGCSCGLSASQPLDAVFSTLLVLLISGAAASGRRRRTGRRAPEADRVPGRTITDRERDRSRPWSGPSSR